MIKLSIELGWSLACLIMVVLLFMVTIWLLGDTTLLQGVTVNALSLFRSSYIQLYQVDINLIINLKIKNLKIK